MTDAQLSPHSPLLAGQVALVTGAARGLGLAIAERLGREGALVLVNDLLPDVAAMAVTGLRDQGMAAEALAFDVALFDTALAQIDAVAARHGRVDILVNNAGSGDFVGFEELTEAKWRCMLDVHLTGAFNRTHAAPRRSAST